MRRRNWFGLAAGSLLVGFVGAVFGLVYAFPVMLDRVWFWMCFAVAALLAAGGVVDRREEHGGGPTELDQDAADGSAE